MKTLSLALRNLLRNRRRSVSTVLAIVIGALAVLMFGGYSRNLTLGLENDYVKYGGHLEIQRHGYYQYGRGNPALYGIEDYQQIIERIKADAVLQPMVRVVTPTLELGGLAGNFAAGVSRTVFAKGLVVDDWNVMRTWNDYNFPIIRPPSALTGKPADWAIIGTGVARVLQLCEPLHVRNCQQPLVAATTPETPSTPNDIAQLAVGEESPARNTSGAPNIELLAATSGGAPNVAALNVAKAEDQGVKELDDVYVGLHLAQAQRLVYGADKPRATAVVVQLNHTASLAAAKARLEQILGDLPSGAVDVMTFQQLNPFYKQAQALFATILGFIAILIGAIVLFTVGNTMSTAIVERTVEIGTLRAMGMRREGIRRLFVCEGLLLGIIGALTGVLLAIGISSLINYSGLTWTPPGRSPVPLIVRVWGQDELVLFTAIGLIAVAILSAWWPARRAARLEVVEALRHV